MANLSFLHHVRTICDFSSFFKFNTPLRGIFATLKVASLHQHPNLLAFLHKNCCGIEVLKNTLCLQVLLLLLELQLGNVLLPPHAP